MVYIDDASTTRNCTAWISINAFKTINYQEKYLFRVTHTRTQIRCGNIFCMRLCQLVCCILNTTYTTCILNTRFHSILALCTYFGMICRSSYMCNVLENSTEVPCFRGSAYSDIYINQPLNSVALEHPSSCDLRTYLKHVHANIPGYTCLKTTLQSL